MLSLFHCPKGIFDKFLPKFVRQYAQIGTEIVDALTEYREDVRRGNFPEEKHTFGGLTAEDLKGLQ